MILEQMSKELSLPMKHIRRMVVTSGHHYMKYLVAKRSGGVRAIEHPSRSLKALQRWLLINVIENWPVHPAAKAYRKGVSILDNAKVHAKSKYLLRMDMKDFFPSITVSDMQAYMLKRAHLFHDWSSEDCAGFCGLVFRYGKLTIGAPTSPAISNALCFDLDALLHSMSFGHGVALRRRSLLLNNEKGRSS
jgi:RNA-directed DNA polymerase